MTDQSKLHLAIRDELLLLLEGDLTEAKARRLSKVATAGATLLKLVSTPTIPKPDELHTSNSGLFIGSNSEYGDQDDNENVGSFAMSPPAETFGARAIKELMASIPMILSQQQNTPERLVNAIASARESGMTDVAAELEKKLTGKALNGDRPINSVPKPALPDKTPSEITVWEPKESGAAFSTGMAIGVLAEIGNVK